MAGNTVVVCAHAQLGWSAYRGCRRSVEPGPALEQELIGFCAQHLSRQKVPRSIDFTDQLPRLPTGKLYKKGLREKYWAGHGSRIL